MMRRISIVMAIALVCAVTQAQAAMGSGVHRHGSPSAMYPTMQYVCKPSDGGRTCQTAPYAHLGARCACDGPRPGVVSTR